MAGGETRPRIVEGTVGEPGYLTAAETAERLRISVRTLEGWRASGLGPAYQTHGRRVVYRRENVHTWLHSQETRGSGEKKPDPMREEAVTAWPYKKDPARYQVSMPYVHPITGQEVRPRKVAPADRRTLEAAIRWGEAERLKLVTALCRDKAKEVPKPITQTQPQVPKAPTLRVFWPDFTAAYVAKQKRSTQIGYRSAWKHIGAVLGDTSMDALDEEELERLRDHLEAQDIEIPTQELYFAKLAKALRWAMGRRKIPRAILARIEFDPVKRRRVPIYSPEDLERLIDRAADPYERVLILLLADGALRIGECAGLQWGDIHYRRRKFGTMLICRNVVLGYEQDSAKGEDGEVPLTPRLAAALKVLQAEQEHSTWVLPRRSKTRARKTLEGSRGRGEHSDEGHLGTHVTRLQEAAGLPGYGPHRVRHSRLTHLAERMIPLRALQHLARHAKESTTEKYYLHVNRLAAAEVAIDELVSMTTSPEPPGNAQATPGNGEAKGLLH
jgi:excisionase family DNA binding protein